MAFCKNCGSPVDGQFCAKCGTPAGAAPAAQAAAPAPPPPAQPYPPAAAASAPQPAAAAGGMTDNLAGLLCYVLGFITGVLFLVLEPYNRNKFIRFHAFQSLFFNLAWIALWIVLSIIGGILMAALPFSMWWLWSIVNLVIWLGFLASWIFLMVKAYQGQRFKLPVIGDLAEKQAGV